MAEKTLRPVTQQPARVLAQIGYNGVDQRLTAHQAAERPADITVGDQTVRLQVRIDLIETEAATRGFCQGEPDLAYPGQDPPQPSGPVGAHLTPIGGGHIGLAGMNHGAVALVDAQ